MQRVFEAGSMLAASSSSAGEIPVDVDGRISVTPRGLCLTSNSSSSPPKGLTGDDLERALRSRKSATHKRAETKTSRSARFFMCSLSTKIIIYKAC